MSHLSNKDEDDGKQPITTQIQTQPTYKTEYLKPINDLEFIEINIHNLNVSDEDLFIAARELRMPGWDEYSLVPDDYNTPRLHHKFISSPRRKLESELHSYYTNYFYYNQVIFEDMSYLKPSKDFILPGKLSTEDPVRIYVYYKHEGWGAGSNKIAYVRTKWDGLYELYYDNGIPTYFREHKAGKLDGWSLDYDHDGNLKEKVFCVNNQLFGPAESWFSGVKTITFYIDSVEVTKEKYDEFLTSKGREISDSTSQTIIPDLGTIIANYKYPSSK